MGASISKEFYFKLMYEIEKYYSPIVDIDEHENVWYYYFLLNKNSIYEVLFFYISQ